VKNKNKTVGLL